MENTNQERVTQAIRSGEISTAASQRGISAQQEVANQIYLTDVAQKKRSLLLDREGTLFK